MAPMDSKGGTTRKNTFVGAYCLQGKNWLIYDSGEQYGLWASCFTSNGNF
jgi:hypothetical protein